MKIKNGPSFLILGCLMALTVRSQSAKKIQIGSQREIFVDQYLIDSLNDLQMMLHAPHDEGPVLYFNKPWEGPFCNYVTIIKDGQQYRAYYRGSQGGKDGNDNELTCMAESADGIHWNRPNLRQFKINGSTKNNVVLAHQAPAGHNFSPFLDSRPDVPANQRYKALALGKGGLMAYHSADGIKWEKLQDKPVITKGAFDSQNVAFWSSSENCYVCYFRSWTKGNFKGLRTVSRVTSADFIHWSNPVVMNYGHSTPENIYIQQTSPYFRAPQIYLAIGARFMQGRQVVSEKQAQALHVNPAYYKDCSDVIFMSTRGGNDYHRAFMEAFIRPAIGLDNWVSRSNYPALNVVQTSKNELSLYLDQDYAQPTAHLERYSLRIDGFTSLHASYHGGYFLSKPFTFSGNTLEINYATSAAGEIRIEIQDENGIAIPGYAMNKSDTTIGNEISRNVSWNGSTDVSKIAGKTIRLKIYMKDADLYSFKFNNN